jgi:carbon storage regulator
MLVLTRKSDEELLIDGCIRVRVLSIEGGRVRLGIVAPRSVPVVRSELKTRQEKPPQKADSTGLSMREVNHACAAIAG